MIRVVFGTFGYVLLFGAFLLIPAPRPVPLRAWVLLGVLLVVRLVGGIAVFQANPTLARERAKAPIQSGQPFADRLLLLSTMASFALLVSLASFDGFRLHLLGSVSEPFASLGILLFVVGWSLTDLALRSNAFALTVIKPQERQAVASAGPYRFVRHPLYLGLVILMIGMSLWLRSNLAALATIVPTGLLAARIVFEERFLRERMEDYRGYSSRVRYRLIPFVW